MQMRANVVSLPLGGTRTVASPPSSSRPPTRSVRPVVRVALFAVLGMTFVVAPGGTAAADEAWRDLLDRMAASGGGQPFQGRLAVVSFDGATPSIGEVIVARAGDGTVMSGRSRRWTLGRVGGEAFFGDAESRTVMRIGSVERTSIEPERLGEKYDVAVIGHEDLAHGSAAVIEVRERGASQPRERLYVDRDTGLLVRRETFDAAGRPVRLTAFTELDTTPSDLPTPSTDDGWSDLETMRADVTGDSIRILREVGWHLPSELPGGFELIDSSTIGEGDRSSVHLLYSDGLYTLSLYEQHGRLDGPAMEAGGAEHVRLGEHAAYRWPGSEPTTYVWSGAGMTFTAITDAPADMLATAVAPLPAEEPPSLLKRIKRGLLRVGRWIWPFS